MQLGLGNRRSPIFLPWEELDKPENDFLRQIGRGVRDYACLLHRKSPEQLTQACKILETPPCQIYHSVWDSICRGNQAIPIPPQFTGGQCPVDYRVTLAVNTYIPGNCNQTNPNGSTSTRILKGPLSGWQFTEGQNAPVTGNCFGSDQIVFSVNGDFVGAEDSWSVFRNFYSTNSNFFDGSYCQLLSFSIERVDGLADDCGDAGLQYPNGQLEEGDGATTIDVINNDGTNFTFDLKLININNNFDIDFFLGDPDTTEGGMGINLGAGGLTFDPAGEGIDAPSDFKKGDDKCKPKKPSFPDLEEEPGEEEEDDDDFEYLKIVLTKFPDRAAYGDTADKTNWFAGHVKFNIDGKGYLPPLYIYSEQSVFEAPENVKGYVVSFRQGASGSITKFKIKSEEEQNNT